MRSYISLSLYAKVWGISPLRLATGLLAFAGPGDYFADGASVRVRNVPPSEFNHALATYLGMRRRRRENERLSQA